MVASPKPELEPTFPEISLVRTTIGAEDTLNEWLGDCIARRSGRQPVIEYISEVDLSDKYAVIIALDNDSTWLDLDAEGLKRMQSIFQRVRGLLWVVRGARRQSPVANMITGFARSTRSENAGISFSTLDLDAEARLSDSKVADIIMRVAELVFDAERPRFAADMEFAEIGGLIHIARILGDKAKDAYVVRETCPPVPEPQPFKQEKRPLKAKLGQIGLLDSVFFDEDTRLQLPLGKDEVDIFIEAAGINFKDIMMSLGQIPMFHDIGLECSGVVSAIGDEVSDLSPGDRVCALVYGAYASSVRTHSITVARIPPNLPFSDAASIPVVFCTAQYALFDMGRLCKGESILIHAAAGGVGQAAIMLAQLAETEIYVTVSSTEKADHLKATYSISEDRIFSSRDISFAKELMRKTNGRGVDVILNSTAGEILYQSWQCLAPLGRFIEIGKRDIVQNSTIEMEKFADSVSFISVDLGILLREKPQALKRLLTDVIELYERNMIRSVTPLTTMPISKLHQAMRMMQGGKHMGKVIIEMKDEDIVQVKNQDKARRKAAANVEADATCAISAVNVKRRRFIPNHWRYRRLGALNHQMARPPRCETYHSRLTQRCKTERRF